MGYIELGSVFSIALLASLGHCIGMCGGIVLSLASTKLAKEYTLFAIAFAHLLYVAGRVSVYMLLGAIAGGVGIVFNEFLTYKPFVLLSINALLMLFGFCLAFLPQVMRLFEPSADSMFFAKIAPIFTTLLHSRLVMSFFLLGAVNGILPCGIVYYFLLSAISSGGVINGALVMGAFGVASVVVMYPFAFFSSVFLRFFHANQNIFRFLAALAMISFGIYGIVGALDSLVDLSEIQ